MDGVSSASQDVLDGSRRTNSSWSASDAWLAGSAGAAAGAVAAAAAMLRCGKLSYRRTTMRAKAKVKPGEKVVGIDLGTTNSAVAALEAGKSIVIPNAEGSRTTPSVVAYSKDSEMLVGEKAKRQAAVNPENTFYSVKRFIGRDATEVASEMDEVPYRVQADESQVSIWCSSLGKSLAPEDISAQVLRKLARDASSFLKAGVSSAVVTVPAYFNDSQRQSTKAAGTIAGLDVLRIINEPTAAALAYGLDKKSNETIVVFDLGGGTFDVSTLVVGDGVCEVLSTNGDTHLGGDDFDKRIVDWLAKGFKDAEGINLLDDSQAVQRLIEAAEQAKVELSAAQEASITLPFIKVDVTGPKHIYETLTRSKFEELCEDLVERCRQPVLKALEDADLTTADIDEVILVGGSTRIRAVQELAKELCGGKTLNQSVNPDEVVALGAAVQAGVLTGEVKDLILLDVIPLSLTLETHNGICSMFVPRNTRIPIKKTKVFTTAKNNQNGVTITVCQGERKFAKDNKKISIFRLTGIPPAPMGVPQIEVTFDVDSNGILSVTAKDQLTGVEQVVTVVGASTLAPEDVERKVKEAAETEIEEALLRRKMEVRNQAETAIFGIERALRENRAKVPQEKAAMFEAKILALKEAIGTEIKSPDFDADLAQMIIDDLIEAQKEVISVRIREKYDEEQGLKAPEEEPRKRKTL